MAGRSRSVIRSERPAPASSRPWYTHSAEPVDATVSPPCVSGWDRESRWWWSGPTGDLALAQDLPQHPALRTPRRRHAEQSRERGCEIRHRRLLGANAGANSRTEPEKRHLL